MRLRKPVQASLLPDSIRSTVADVDAVAISVLASWSHGNVVHVFSGIKQVSPRPNTFLPFGTGIHSCPGNEFAKLEMLVLVHHLVTKYRSDLVGAMDF
ncbi:abscisic acid 8'-hydroxylase 2-like [Nymphaea colorata]|nr:abscisic acid 8'-hydroxylase 2-like [Nymphaea colorata]